MNEAIPPLEWHTPVIVELAELEGLLALGPMAATEDGDGCCALLDVFLGAKLEATEDGDGCCVEIEIESLDQVTDLPPYAYDHVDPADRLLGKDSLEVGRPDLVAKLAAIEEQAAYDAHCDAMDAADIEAGFLTDRARAARKGEQRQETFLVRASEIKPQPISWLWKYWLARGKLHIIAGAPGGGKTTIYLSFAAIISSGGTWPEGTRAAVGNVLIWTSEDGHADTIIPRLMRMGANLDRIFIVKGQCDAKGKARPFNPATDMDSLREKAATIPGGVDFTFLDPVVATVASTKNGDKNVETRAGLAPFVEFAEAINAAAGGVTHVSKGTGGKDPLERVTGSLAYGAVPRIVLLAAENKAIGDDQPERIMVRAKNNVGPKDGGFGYHIDTAYLQENPDIEATRIVWELPLEGTALELLNSAEGDQGGKVTKLEEAKRFLRAALAKGERPMTEVKESAAAENISWGTLERASKEERVIKRKDGLSVWFWSLS